MDENERMIEQLQRRVRELEKQVLARDSAEGDARLLWRFADRTHDAIYVIEPSTGRFLDVNQRACELLRRDREDLLSLTVRDVQTPAPTPEVFGEHVRDLARCGGMIREETHRRKDGGTFPVETSFRYVRNPGGDTLVAVSRDLTGRKETADKPTDNLHFRDILLDTIPSPIFYKDTEGVYLGCNAAFARQILGMPREEILGKSLFDLPDAIPPDLARIYHAQDLCLLRERKVQVYEEKVRCADGLRRDFLFTKGTFETAEGEVAGIIGVMLDISDRKVAEEELRKRERRYNLILDAIPDLVLELELDGTVIYANPWASQALSIPGERLGKIDIAELLDGPNQERVRGEMAKVAGARAVSVNVPYTLHSTLGKEIPVEAHAIPLEQGDRPPTILVMARDVSQRVQGEQERRDLEALLRHSQKMEAVGTLAGGIAHDFNNILAAMNGYTELAMLETQTGSRLRANLEQVLVSGKRARDLVAQILAFSRQGCREKTVVDLGHVVREALHFLRATVPSTVEIRENLRADRATVLADPTQIRQVLMNLGINAAQAMENGCGVIRVDLERVESPGSGGGSWLQDLKPGPYLKLSVSDTGKGIDPSEMNRIFDPFFSTRGPGRGAGMGLSVAHGIVQDHDGVIACTSGPGPGTTFHVFLPWVPPEEPARADPSPVPRFSGGKGKGRILYVDDEQALVDFARQALERCGHQVFCTTSSADALAVFRSRPGDFDLVITDLTMPAMTGTDLSREILRIRPGIPILLCTGFSEEVTAEKAAQAGVRETLQKPILLDQLNRAVAEALGQAGESQRPAGTRPSILVVDDDEQLREMLLQTLDLAGYRVTAACNGLEGMKMFRSGPADLVVTDLFMPEKDGLETIMELRKQFPGTRIIAISGGWRGGPHEYLKTAMKLGASRAFTKPVEREVLLRAIREVLEEDRP